MRVGKSRAFGCDFCGEVIVGAADLIRRSGNEMHFCPGSCLDEYLLENHIRTKVEEAVEPKVREEWNIIHKQVCPACRYRLQKLL